MQSKFVIGVVPDGNRTYAEREGLTDLNSVYRRGAQIAVDLVEWALQRGDVEEIVFYALSNYDLQNRSVAGLEAIRCGIEEFRKLTKQIPGIYMRTLGHKMKWGVGSTIMKEEPKLMITLLIDYSPEFDLKEGISVGVADLDVVIRTSGAKRLSGFLPIQSSYAELIFTPTLWPEFTVAEFDKILEGVRQTQQEFERRGGRGA